MSVSAVRQRQWLLALLVFACGLVMVSFWLRHSAQQEEAKSRALAADLAGEGLSGVRVVGRGVDAELFDPERRDPALRKRWGVADEGPVCLYVGRLAPEKNLALVERSFAAIQVWYPQARMVWVGDGPSASQLATDHPDHHFAGMRTGATWRRTTPAPTSFSFPA